MTKTTYKQNREVVDEDLDEEAILAELNEAEEEYQWVSDNWNDLQDEFEEEYVAIKNHEVIDHKSTLEGLRSLFETDPNIIIEFFPPKKTAMLLQARS